MQLKYRPELDGLRMVAMIVVFIGHLSWVFPVPDVINTVFSGGFLMVDIFFTISGYVISRIIIRSLLAGNFSFWQFYERRIRRIIPPLLFAVFTCILVAVLLLDAPSLKRFGTSLLGIGGFVSNYTFYTEANYFSPKAHQFPFLNTWSLGVEEQFYAFFPPLFVFGWYFLKQHVVWVFAALFVASLTYAELTSGLWPEANFFGPQARIWEFMLGALVAMAEFSRWKKGLERPQSQTMVALGLAIIFLNIALMTPADKHPSLGSLGAMLGTAMVIWYGGTTGWSGALLANKTSALIGRMTYPLYLWHFPVLVFWSLSSFSQTAWYGPVIVVGLTFAFSAISLWVIEAPCRRAIPYKKLLWVIVPLWLLMIAIGAWFHFSKGVPERLSYPPELENSFALPMHLGSSGIFCLNAPVLEGHPLPLCDLGRGPQKKPDFILAGDSHAFAAIPAFDAVATRHNLRGAVQTGSACLPVLGLTVYRRGGVVESCAKRNDAVFDYVKNHDIKNIFLVARWPSYVWGAIRPVQLEPRQFAKTEAQRKRIIKTNLTNTLQKYKELGVNVYVLEAGPEFRSTPRQIYAGLYLPLAPERNSQQAQEYLRYFAADRPQPKPGTTDDWFNNLFSQFKQQGLIADYVRVIDYLCDAEKCPVGTPNRSDYYDKDHLSVFGAKKLEPALEATMAALAEKGK